MATVEASVSATHTQLANTFLMIRPDQFGFNEQTASTNAFQTNPDSLEPAQVRDQAMAEFSGTVDLLSQLGLTIVVCPSRSDVHTPDAVFPNNWISFHGELDDINVILYPMLAPNRRAERQLERVKSLMPWMNIDPERVLDLTSFEQADQFLEGTGSLVFDRPSRTVFAHQSARTSFEVLDVFCQRTGYEAVKFRAIDKGRIPIYHTNVVMAIGEAFSVVCLEAIPDRGERSTVESRLRGLGKDIIDISLDQLYAFCGNVLQVQPVRGSARIIMSVGALNAFSETQKQQLEKHGDLTALDITTIENVGGGSARCILAEVFPSKQQANILNSINE